MSKAIYFCFTVNNWTHPQLMKLRELTMLDNSPISYISWAQEIGENGTPHLQGYMETSKRMTYSQLFKFIGFTFHLEKRKASSGEEAEDYFKHPENHDKPPAVGYECYGTMSKVKKGQRSDLLKLKETIDSGASLQVVADSHFGEFLKYGKNIREYMRLKSSPRDFQPEVHVHWGDTGTGKTRKAFESHDSVWIHPGGPWFDGYEGHHSVIFDEYHGGYFSLTYLLKLLDRYPMQVPIKGGFLNWRPQVIFLTAQTHPKDWYNEEKCSERIKALLRRITTITHFQAPPDPDALDVEQQEQWNELFGK